MRRLSLLNLLQFAYFQFRLDFNPFLFSQVIYQLRLPGDYKFFTFKRVNVTISKKKKKENRIKK